MTRGTIPNEKTFDGPLESGTWTQRLRAYAVTPGPHPRLWGYDVTRDLAANYSFSDLLYLALKGELPTLSISHAFGRVLMLLAPTTVAEAPTHAALLARLSGADPGSTLGVAAIGLAEQAKDWVESLPPLLSWLDCPTTEFPKEFLGFRPEDRSATEALADAMQRLGLDVPGIDQFPNPRAALVCVLHACGIRSVEHLQSLWVISRLPCVLAEAFAVKSTAFREYPANLPNFNYTECAP